MADSTQGFTPAIKIENPILHVNRVKLQPTIVDSLRRKIETGATCKYVFDRMLLTHPVSVPLGSTHFTYKLTQGQTPRVILAMFVDNKGITGSYTNNCFLMDNMNVTECSAIVYGDTYPAKPYSLKFDGISGKSYNVTRMYTEFMRAMGFWQSNFGNAIKLVEYAHDNTFFCFPISHETKPTNFNVPVQKGPVTLDFTFKEPLQIEKLMITACFMQSAAYIGRGGSTWTSYILNSGLDDFEAGLA